MTRAERNSLIVLFREHINHITNLQFGNYVLAETLCSKTKLYASKYFEKRTYYFYDLANINFKTAANEHDNARSVWDDAYRRLLAIANSMLEELQLDEMHDDGKPGWNIKKGIISGLFLLISSSFLWSFHGLIKWEWLNHHPKPLPIYISFQVALVFIFLLFITNNKQVRLAEWLGIAASVVAMIVSSIA